MKLTTVAVCRLCYVVRLIRGGTGKNGRLFHGFLLERDAKNECN